MQIINQHSIIGDHHVNHNEDALFSTKIDNKYQLIALMDGCSMGTDSHFAATLFKKILSKTSKTLSCQLFIQKNRYSLDALIKDIIKALFYELQQIQNQLFLSTEELLSTLIVGLVDLEKKNALIHCIGDGIIYHQGQWIEFDQNDRPDYLAYHLDEDFEQYYKTQNQILTLKNIKDLSICTDGILSFRSFDLGHYPDISSQAILHCLLDTSVSSASLKQKLLTLEQDYGLRPTDDLSIIQLVL